MTVGRIILTSFVAFMLADGLLARRVLDAASALQATSTLPSAASESAPNLVSPADGSTLAEIAVALTWQNPPATTQIEVRVLPYGNDGPGVDMILGSPQESYHIEAPRMGLGPYVLLPDLGYVWMVRSSTAAHPLDVDSLEWGPWAASRTFRTPAASASGITAVSPAAGAAGQSRTPTVQWTDTRTDVFYYEVQMSRDPRFETHPVRATSAIFWNLVHGGETVPRNSWTVPVSAALQPGMTYHWRVRPRVQGDGTPVGWSPVWSFTVAP